MKKGNAKSAKPSQKAQRKLLTDLCFLWLFLCAFCVPKVVAKRRDNSNAAFRRSNAGLMSAAADEAKTKIAFQILGLSFSPGVLDQSLVRGLVADRCEIRVS